MADPEGAWPDERRVSPGSETVPDDLAQLLMIRQAELADAQRRFVELRLRQSRLQIVRARMGLVLRILLFALLLFLGLLLALVAIDAAGSERLVVKTFDVPEAVERNGATGGAVAALLADELERLRSEAVARPGQRVGPLFTRQIAVEPAATGPWLPRVHSRLTEILGNDIHVSGSLIRAEDGTLRLTLRGDGIGARSFSGRSRELPALAARGAGHVFGSAAPPAYLRLLVEAGRPAAATEFAAAAFHQSQVGRERSTIAQLWAEALAAEGRHAEAQERARLAISLDPVNWPAYATLVAAAPDDEAALAASRWFRRRAAEAPPGQRPDESLFADEYRLTQNWSALAGLGSGQGANGLSTGAAAAAEALRHDHQGALRRVATALSDDPLAGPASDLVAGLRELDLGRADRAIPPLERFSRALAATPQHRQAFRGERCHLALAYARIGLSREALKLLAAERESARCRAFRGDVLALAGNWPAAESAYRAAMGAFPNLSVPRERAAAALLAREQPEPAARLFREAIALAPNWADPRFGLAEALTQLGRFAEAEPQYRAAARFAPRWGALHIGWGEALWRLGRHEEARRIWRAAAGMSLSAANRMRIEQLLSLPNSEPTAILGASRPVAYGQASRSASAADLGLALVTVTRVPWSVMP